MNAISFYGVDGSGKSTQSRLLAERLRGSGVAVQEVHLLTKGNTVSSNLQGKPFIKRLHKKLRDLPFKGFSGVFKLIIGVMAFFVDAWVTHFQHRLQYRGRVVVYDRFFYDYLVLFAASFPKTPLWVVRLLKYFPKSDLAVSMAVPPDVGHMRKPEESIAKLTKCLRLYQLAAIMLKSEMIDGTQSIQVISDSVYTKWVGLGL